MCQRDVVDELARHPSLDDVDQALKRLSNRKAAGQSAIAPEMLKTATPTIRPYLLDLLQTAWSTSCVPQDWRDALLVPILKKSDPIRGANWRGIALLDVVGKLFGHIVQERLQSVAARELPEAQCGFRAGHGCPDAIFSVHQIAEKTFKHREKVFACSSISV